MRSTKHIKQSEPTVVTPRAIFPVLNWQMRRFEKLGKRPLTTSGTIHKAKLHGCVMAEAERKNGTAADLVPGAVTHVNLLVENVFTNTKITE